MNKQHTKDYLEEYISGKSGWLPKLIQNIISRNANLSSEEKNQIFSGFLKSKQLITASTGTNQIAQEESAENNSSSKNIAINPFYLKKIEHVQGVNALMRNQLIAFSDSCTVIYGLNGTGKSGYFRIINELAGASKQKNILGNVYQNHNESIAVNIDYSSANNTDLSICWDNSSRGIEPFNKIKVFDSEYLPVFLNERQSAVNIEPLGLHLFKLITDTIDEFKTRLQAKVDEYNNQRPDLSPLIELLHSNELQLLLSKSVLTGDEKIYLTKKSLFTETNKSCLAKLKIQKNNLEKNNSNDRVKILEQEKSDIENLASYLSKIKSDIENITQSLAESIENYILKKRLKDSRVNEFKALQNIPSQKSTEWESFITSAIAYEKLINKEEFDFTEKCIYCHQLLDPDFSFNSEALNLVQAYSKYLEDQSQLDFTKASNKLGALTDILNSTNINFDFSDSLDEFLESVKTDNQTYKLLVLNCIEQVKEQKKVLKDNIQELSAPAREFTLVINHIQDRLKEKIDSLISEIAQYNASSQEKTNKIKKLSQIIFNLEDKENINNWLEKITKYYECCELAKNFSNAKNEFNTSNITRLASTAHDELLTDTIRESFQHELKSLGKNVNVNIQKTKAGKGSVHTKLAIEGKDVTNILSEGEQKKVALALFIAEIKSQNFNFPVVFDDPVTSLDHEIADAFAHKLLQMSLDRQIIIFTHNKLFYDSLVDWGGKLKNDTGDRTHHVCKNYTASGCNGTGNHVLTYKLERVDRENIGKVIESKQENCKYYLNEAKFQIENQSNTSIIGSLLKSAIEHYIDENIMLKIGLMKDRKNRENIPWDRLNKIKSSQDSIQQLKKYWDDLSSRATHLTQNSSENPLTTEDFNEIIQFMEK